jgi:hypothetical protein
MVETKGTEGMEARHQTGIETTSRMIRDQARNSGMESAGFKSEGPPSAWRREHAKA